MAEEMTEKPTEGTTPGGKYLTRDYLVINLQKFWNKIKAYLNKALDGKVNIETGKGLSTNDFTDTDKNKLNGIAENANNYSHPDTSGNKHIPGGGSEGQILRWGSDGTAVWGDDNNTTYSDATTSAAGLMSATDKGKLNSIVEGANRTEVDATLDKASTNPVQNKAIYEALNNKVSIENLKDPSNLLDQGLSCESNNDGDIVLTHSSSPVHVKIHTESCEIIEQFYRSFKNKDSSKELTFDSFGSNRSIIIPNPDGKGNLPAGKSYRFYVECFELSDTGKYKPFILKVARDGTDPKQLTPTIFGE